MTETKWLWPAADKALLERPSRSASYPLATALALIGFLVGAAIVFYPYGPKTLIFVFTGDQVFPDLGRGQMFGPTAVPSESTTTSAASPTVAGAPLAAPTPVSSAAAAVPLESLLAPLAM